MSCMQPQTSGRLLQQRITVLFPLTRQECDYLKDAARLEPECKGFGELC